MYTPSALLHAAASPAADPTPALTRHLRHCEAARGRWFDAAAWAERAHGLVAHRFVTTVSLVAVLLVVCGSWA